MVQALGDYKILGLRHSIKYLAEIVAHDKFGSGETYTDFIDRNFSDWEDETEVHLETALAAAAVANANRNIPSAGSGQKSQTDYNPWLTMGSWRIGEKIS